MKSVIFLLFLVNQGVDFEDLYNKATTLLVQFEAEKDSAFNKLVELGQDSLYGDTTIDFLVSKFDTKSAIERHRLKDIFKKIGTRGIKGIVKKIDYRGSDEEDRALKQSLWVLGEIGSEEIVEPVARFIKDKEWKIRSGAFTALGKAESRKAVPYIIEGLGDSIAVVRKSAYYALSRVAEEDDIPYLLRGLDDEFYGVRYAAVAGLVKIGEPALEPLLGSIGDNSLKDFFVFKTLSEIDGGKTKLDSYVKKGGPEIRLIIYEVCDDKDKLLLFLENEKHEILKNFLRKRISEL